MAVICIEGASAVGKTTTSRVLENEYNFQVIPEVNKMFERPKNEPATWYFEKQLERIHLAEKISVSGGHAVLDGDPMQPLWYNKIYEEQGFQPMQLVIDFYSSAIKNENIQFPDKYFILTSDEFELRRRKSGDKISRRSNFEKHLSLINPQLAYFRSLNVFLKEGAEFIENVEPNLTAQIIAGNMPHSEASINQKALLLHQFQFLNEM